jgi:hypothetical protein
MCEPDAITQALIDKLKRMELQRAQAAQGAAGSSPLRRCEPARQFGMPGCPTWHETRHGQVVCEFFHPKELEAPPLQAVFSESPTQ